MCTNNHKVTKKWDGEDLSLLAVQIENGFLWLSDDAIRAEGVNNIQA